MTNHHMHTKRPNPDGKAARRACRGRYIHVSKPVHIAAHGPTYRRRPAGERKLTKAEKKRERRLRRATRILLSATAAK